MIYHFENIELNTQKMTISKDNIPLSFEPKLFELLVFFCKNPDRAISRDELIRTVWRDRVVSEAAVNRAVAQLRKLIEQDTSTPKFIITISKVGYKFVASIKTENRIQEKTPNFCFSLMSKIKSKPFLSLTSLCIMTLLIFGVWQVENNDLYPNRNVDLILKKQITDSSGMSFNSTFDEHSKSIYYLFRASYKSNAQIKVYDAQKANLDITHDDYYYTDVISINKTQLLAARLDNVQDRNCEIVIIDKNDLSVTKVTQCGKSIINTLDYDHENNRVLYRYREIASQPYAILSTSLASSRTQELTHPHQNGNTQGHTTFTLSPDEKAIIYTEYQLDASDKLYIQNLRTQKVLSTILVPKDIIALTWLSADLLIASNAEQLFSIDLVSKAVTLIDSEASFGRLSPAADTSEVLTEHSYFHTNLTLTQLDKGVSSNLTHIDGIQSSHSVSHHDTQVIFHSRTKQNNRILIRNANNQIIDTQFPAEFNYIANSAWSKDDKKVIASVDDQLFLLDVDNLTWSLVKIPFKKVHYVDFINNNKILLSAENKGDWNLWSLALSSGKYSQITKNEGYSGKIFNNKLYYTKFSQNGLFYKSLASNEEHVLLDDFPLTNWYSWQIVNKHLFYRTANQYFLQNLDTGSEKAIFHNSSHEYQDCKLKSNLTEIICNKRSRAISNIWSLKFSVQHEN